MAKLRASRWFLLVILFCLLAPSMPAAAQAPGSVQHISPAVPGQPPHTNAVGALSDDGRRVVFRSEGGVLDAIDLPLSGPSGVMGEKGVYLWDAGDAVLYRVPDSYPLDARERNADSATISGDGRFVVYSTSWQTPSQELTQTTRTVWRYDTQDGTLTDLSGSLPEGWSPRHFPKLSVSDDGSVVAFESYGPVSLNGLLGLALELYQLGAGSSSIAIWNSSRLSAQPLPALTGSFPVSGSPGGRWQPRLSGDGSTLIYQQHRYGMGAQPLDLIIASMSDQSQAVVATVGFADYLTAGAVALTDDGRGIAYASSAHRTDGVTDVFYQNRTTLSPTLISRSSSALSNGDAERLALTNDGSGVLFTTQATNLLAAPGRGPKVYDFSTNQLRGVPVDLPSGSTTLTTATVAWSGDASTLSFSSTYDILTTPLRIRPSVYTARVQPPPREVAVDTNFLIPGIEGTPEQRTAVDTALGGRRPVVSPQAQEEFLVGGSSEELSAWLAAHGGRVGPAHNPNLGEHLIAAGAAADPPRTISLQDAHVATSAMEDNLALLTSDQQLHRYLEWYGWRTEWFNPAATTGQGSAVGPLQLAVAAA